jgi:hypothetical protein
MAACVETLPVENEYMVKIGRLIDGKYLIFEQEQKVIGGTKTYKQLPVVVASWRELEYCVVML